MLSIAVLREVERHFGRAVVVFVIWAGFSDASQALLLALGPESDGQGIAHADACAQHLPARMPRINANMCMNACDSAFPVFVCMHACSCGC